MGSSLSRLRGEGNTLVGRVLGFTLRNESDSLKPLFSIHWFLFPISLQTVRFFAAKQ